MARNRARAKKADVPSQIQVEVSVNGEKRVFLEPAPEGIPPNLFPHLADFWRRGFTAADTHQSGPQSTAAPEVIDLSEFAPSSRGRPMDNEAEREGQQGSRLRREDPSLTYGDITRRVCRYRDKPAHRCKKACNDRVRQAIKQYEVRQELERIARGDGDE